jgi:hypothetical protein
MELHTKTRRSWKSSIIFLEFGFGEEIDLNTVVQVFSTQHAALVFNPF